MAGAADASTPQLSTYWLPDFHDFAPFERQPSPVGAPRGIPQKAMDQGPAGTIVRVAIQLDPAWRPRGRVTPKWRMIKSLGDEVSNLATGCAIWGTGGGRLTPKRRVGADLWEEGPPRRAGRTPWRACKGCLLPKKALHHGFMDKVSRCRGAGTIWGTFEGGFPIVAVATLVLRL